MKTYPGLLLILSLVFEVPTLVKSAATVISKCCEGQGQFQEGGVCVSSFGFNGDSSEDIIPFPRFLNWTLSQGSGKLELKLWSNVLDFQCSDKYFVVNVSKNHAGQNDSIFNLLNSSVIDEDGYLSYKNMYYPSIHYCVNRVLDDDSSMEIIVCNKTCDENNLCIPKCCPWNRAATWMHPELCTNTRKSSLRSNISMFNDSSSYFHSELTIPIPLSYYLSPIDCVKENKMVSTQVVDMSNLIEIKRSLNEVGTRNHCFDDVLVAHVPNYDFRRDKAIFYCDKFWPYDEFGPTSQEKLVYGICLLFSTFFGSLAIAAYYIKLTRTHCNVHTWIEFYYMIFLILLAAFCILQVYFPEDFRQLCTFYHFFSVVGYVMFAIGHLSWATLLSFELFLAFKNLRSPIRTKFEKQRHRLYFYTAVGFLFPACVTGALFLYSYLAWYELVMNGMGYCLPVQFKAMRIIQGVLLLINFFFCLCTILLILKHRKFAKLANNNSTNSASSLKSTRRGGGGSIQQLNQLMSCFVKLYLICGMTYVGVIIGYVIGSSRYSHWYLLVYRAFLNLRGVTIFLVYCCNANMRTLLWHYYKREAPFCDCCLCSGGSVAMTKRHNVSRISGSTTYGHSTIRQKQDQPETSSL